MSINQPWGSLQTIISLINDTNGTRVEISDGARTIKAKVSKDSKNIGVGKLCLGGTINLICWSRTKDYITIHSYTTSNVGETVTHPPGLSRSSEQSGTESSSLATMVIASSVRPFDLSAFDNTLDGFSVESCVANIEALERYISTRPPDSMSFALLEALTERGEKFTLFFLSRCSPSVIDHLNSNLNAIHPSETTKILGSTLLNFVALLPPNIDLDRQISDHHRSALLHSNLAEALEARITEIQRFESARDRELALASEISTATLSQKDRKRPANLISAESGTIKLFKSCYKDFDLPSTVPGLNGFIESSQIAQLEVLKELMHWVGSSSDENIRIVIDNAYLYPNSPKTLKPFSLSVHQPGPRKPSDKPLRSVEVVQDEESRFEKIERNSAYPAVQPRKAAEHFDEPAENFGDWTILLSGRAIRDFRQLKDGKKFKIVQQKLVELSFGRFWADNQKKLVGNDTEVPIYEAKVLNDLRLVYQIDMQDEGELSRQILRVWGLESHSTLDRRVWEAISRHSHKRGKEYRTRCLYRREALSKGAKVQSVSLPQTFPIQLKAIDVDALSDPSLTDKEMLELHDLLALSKFIPLSNAVVKSILAQDEEAAHLFSVSGKEREIIEHPGSSFVIGRSGTGKTTCIVFKIVGVEQAWADLPELTAAPPRQLFLTQSPVLASKVKSYFTNIVKTATTAKLTAEQAEALAKEKEVRAEDLEDLEDEAGGLKGLPSRFSDLTPQHYPLFISIDTLLHLLEADYGIDWGKKTSTAGHKQAFKRFAIADIAPESKEIETPVNFDDDAFDKIANNVSSTGLWQHHVDASVFESWFHSFDKRLTKGLDPTLCWSEILGTIRGSELACETPNGYISRQQYLDLSVRTSSTYADLRPAIYSIFEAYMERKGIQGDFDRADRTHALIRAFRTQGIRLVNQVTHVYVDEVQDLLLAHCSMLRFLTSNPQGWMFAGDTAQTIAAGSSFRFNDLKAVTYRCEERDAIQMKRKPVESALFTLGVNYRSHAGITEVGNLLVSSLLTLFPNSIDQLPAEKGAVAGPKPVWLSGHDEESFTNFLFGESGNAVEFGAEQCILVRNEEAREALREKTSDIGLILTIEESKGLEFSDVLLYDFFSDSTATAHDWRVLLRLLPEPPAGLPAFDRVRHAVVGQELRHLYVAVTRARNILWFVDRDNKGDAVKDYLSGSKVIKVCRPGDELPVIGAASSPEQWSKQGRTMYGRKNYRQAALCFRKAGATLEESIALAYEDRRNVRAAARLGKTSTLVDDYYRLATSFRQCGRDSTSTQAISLFLVAADLFISADKPILSAGCYELAGDYEKAAQLYLKGRDVDEAVRVVIRHKIEGQVKEEVWFSARLLYLKNNQLSKVREMFEDEESQIQFMESFGFDGQKRAFYIEIGRFGEAAALDFDSGEFWSAFELFSKVGDRASKISSVRALLELLAQTLPLGCSDDWEGYGNTFETAGVYVKQAENVLKDVGDNIEELDKITREFRMYRLITEKALPELLKLSREFENEGDRASQLNSLDVALSVPPVFDTNTTVASIRIYLKNVKQYATLVEGLVSDLDIDDANIRRLFGLDTRTLYADDSVLSELRVLPTSPLVASLRAKGHVGETLLASSIPPLAKAFLTERLDYFLCDASEILQESKILLPPCPVYSFTGSCEASPCKYQHLGATLINEGLYQDRVAVIAQIIELVERIDASTPPRAKNTAIHQNIWHSRLSEVLYPTHPFASGHISELRENWKNPTTILTARARKTLYQYTPEDQNVIMSFLPAAIISSDFDKRNLYDIPITRISKRKDLVAFDQKLITAKLVSILALDHNAPIKLEDLDDAKDAVALILDRGLDVDISFLVHYIEEVVLLTILKSSNDGILNDKSWHKTMLPISLMRRLVDGHRDRKSLEFVPIAFKAALLDLIRTLTVGVFSGANHMKDHNGAPIIGYARYVLAARLIRLVILMGINNEDLRDNALAAIQSHSKIAVESNYLTTAFIEASEWSTLQFEVIQRSRRFHLDRIVQLDLSSKNILKATVGVQVFRSQTLQGIERHLFKNLSSKSKNPYYRSNGNETSTATAEEETEAAHQIQAFLKDRHEKRKERIDWDSKPLNAFWSIWNEKSINQKSFILGPLVELVFALDGQKRRLQKAKDFLKKKLATSLEVSKVADSITTLNTIFKELQDLLSNLKPTSNFIKNASLVELQVELAPAPALFNRANDFLLELYDIGDERRFSSELVEIFKVGEKGIFTLAKKSRKVRQLRPTQKPSMGIVDDEEGENWNEDEDDEAERRGRLGLKASAPTFVPRY